MPKPKTRDKFYWMTYEINAVGWWNLASLYHITKEKILSKNSATAVVSEEFQINDLLCTLVTGRSFFQLMVTN